MAAPIGRPDSEEGNLKIHPYINRMVSYKLSQYALKVDLSRDQLIRRILKAWTDEHCRDIE